MAEKPPVLGGLETPRSLRERAFQVIKEAILANKLEPSKVYSEQGIADQLGISKTPVREALMDLNAKGFVTFLPRRGFQIRSLSEREIRDLFEFRAFLETAVIRKIAGRINHRQMEKIELLRKRDVASAKAHDWRSFVKVDREFHLFLASLTDNLFIINALENVRDLVDWTGAKILERKERHAEAVREHSAIIEMLQKQDTQGAVSAMQEHMKMTEKLVLTSFRIMDDLKIKDCR